MVKFRIEKDRLGTIKVENSKLWGAQTQRSIKNFNIALKFKPNHAPAYNNLGMILTEKNLPNSTAKGKPT